MSMPVVFLDCETTSLNRITRRPWDVAIIRRDENGEMAERQFFISPVDLTHADPFSLRVGHFYQRHPDYGDTRFPTAADREFHLCSERTAAHTVEMWVRDAVVVGINPSFDEDVLASMLVRHGLLWSAHYNPVDVKPLCAGYLRARGTNLDLPYSTEDLVKHMGVDPVTEEERHTALGDAKLAMRLFDAVQAG